jgi:hypothetical protein
MVAKQTAYCCPTCGQPAPKPVWLESRESGFDSERHCRVMANATGRVIDCVGPAGLCDLCPIGIQFGVQANSKTKKLQKEK